VERTTHNNTEAGWLAKVHNTSSIPGQKLKFR